MTSDAETCFHSESYAWSCPGGRGVDGSRQAGAVPSDHTHHPGPADYLLRPPPRPESGTLLKGMLWDLLCRPAASALSCVLLHCTSRMPQPWNLEKAQGA